LALASAADSLWQSLLLEREADGVTPGIGQFGQSLGQTEYEQRRGVGSDRDTGLPALDPVERHAAHRCPLRHQCDRDPPPAPRVAEVSSQLEEGAPDGNRERRATVYMVHNTI
jgi:hypothetical protein